MVQEEPFAGLFKATGNTHTYTHTLTHTLTRPPLVIVQLHCLCVLVFPHASGTFHAEAKCIHTHTYPHTDTGTHTHAQSHTQTLTHPPTHIYMHTH